MKPYRPRSTETILKRLLPALVLCAPSLGTAAIVEEVIDVPVSVKTMFGQEVSQSIKVTVFRDDEREKAPYLVLNHGRPASERDFAAMKRQRYSGNSRYFVSLGFVVIVPTRVGYGDSGGVDVEYSGKCSNKSFGPAYAAAADQTAAVLEAARSLGYVDLSKGIVTGQSFGGTTAITLSTKNLPGLIGAVNFAGGGGGNPVTKPETPCGAGQMTDLFRIYGSSSLVPSIWFYSENDRYWGAELPKKWFKAFVDAGGNGQFVQLPPYKENGHPIFTGNPDSWKPAFEQFIHEIGF